MGSYPDEIASIFHQYEQMGCNTTEAYYFLQDNLQRLMNKKKLRILKKNLSHIVLYYEEAISIIDYECLSIYGWELDGCEELYLSPEQYPDVPDEQIITFWFEDNCGNIRKYALAKPQSS